MENIIAKIVEKQQSVLESVVCNAVKEALAEIDTSLQHIRTELERQGATVRDLVQRLDKTQGDSRQMRNIVNACVENRAGDCYRRPRRLPRASKVLGAPCRP